MIPQYLVTRVGCMHRSWNNHDQILKDLGKITQDLVTTIQDRTCHELAKYWSNIVQDLAKIMHDHSEHHMCYWC